MIYICIPARDEEHTIGVLLWKIRRVLSEFERDYRILVLDDASTDRTPEVLNRYRRVLPLTVLREEERIGYPRALERLVREAVDRAPYPKRDSVVTLQADFTESPEHIVSLVKVLEGGADVVAGVLGADPDDEEARSGPAPEAPLRVRLARRFAPWALGSAFRGAPVSDPLCGIRAYRIVCLQKALRQVGSEPLLSAEGWAANVELLSRATVHARRIEEVPLEMRWDLRQRDTRFRPVRTLRELFRLRGRLVWPRGEEAA